MDDIKPVSKKSSDKPEPKSAEEFVEPAFVEPEAIATNEETPEDPKKSSKKKLFPISFNFSKWSKKKKIIASAVMAGVLIGGGLGLYFFVLKSDPPPPVVQQEVEPEPEPPKPTTEASRLSGLQITPELNQRSITAVMIENSVDARPQAGLKDAGVVFEAIAEGGITRFVALFQETQPDYIGPVRSARPYYIDWIMAFDPAYAHAGGSGEALNLIRSLGMKDIEHGANGDAFRRVSNRYAPHNLYTSTADLDRVKERRGYNTSNFTSLVRKADAPAAAPSAGKINFNVSSANYGVHYDYDAASNSYKRVLAGRAHLDEKSGAQLSPKVVVALIVPYRIHPDGVHSQYTTLGTGKAYIFQDGAAQEVTWHKADRTTQITFTDAAGKPVGLNAGQTWFTALASADRVTFSP